VLKGRSHENGSRKTLTVSVMLCLGQNSAQIIQNQAEQGATKDNIAHHRRGSTEKHNIGQHNTLENRPKKLRMLTG